MALVMTPTIDCVIDLIAAFRAKIPVIITTPTNLPRITATYGPHIISNAGTTTYTDAPPTTTHPDLALLLSTSGSTGSAKLVRLTYSNIAHNAHDIATTLNLTDTDVAITAVPLHYTYGLSVLFSHLSVRATISLTDQSVTEPHFWHQIREHQVTTLPGVPFTFELLDQLGNEHLAKPTSPALRRITQAGGKLPANMVKKYAALGNDYDWDFYVMYGATEATARMTCLPPRLALTHPDAVGLPVPSSTVSLRRVDDQPDHVGELIFCGPGVMLGYATCRADCAQGPSTPMLAQQQLATGDVATIDDDGVITVVGRLSDFAKIAGQRIDLPTVRDWAREWQFEVALTCAEDHLVVAVVGDSTRAFQFSERLAHMCGIPAASITAVPVEELPRTPSHKIDYPAVKKMAATQRTDHASTCLADVQSVFSKHFPSRQICDADSFATLGGDSLAYVAVSIDLARVLGDLPPSWQQLSITQLQEHQRRPGGRLTRLDTTVALRAVAIVLIVTTHTGLFDLAGGAHTLLAVAGYNLARFHTATLTGWARVRAVVRNLGGLVALTWPLLLIGFLTNANYSAHTLTYTHTLLPWRQWSDTSRFWFVDVLVWGFVIVAAVLALPVVRSARHSSLFWLWGALAVVGVGLRYVVGPPAQHTGAGCQLVTVWWFFAVGLALAHATRWHHRALLSVVAVVPTIGFFADLHRDVTIAAGLLVLIWVPTIKLPYVLVKVLQPLAAASLFIYMLHFDVQSPLLEAGHPWLAATVPYAVGMGYAAILGHLSYRAKSSFGSLRWRRVNLWPTLTRPSPALTTTPTPNVSSR